MEPSSRSRAVPPIIDDGGTQTLRIPAIVRPPRRPRMLTLAIFGVGATTRRCGPAGAFTVEPKSTSRSGMLRVLSVVTSRAEPRAGMRSCCSSVARPATSGRATDFKIAFEHPEAIVRPPQSVKMERVLHRGRKSGLDVDQAFAWSSSRNLSRVSTTTIGAMQITSPADKRSTGPTLKLAKNSHGDIRRVGRRGTARRPEIFRGCAGTRARSCDGPQLKLRAGYRYATHAVSYGLAVAGRCGGARGGLRFLKVWLVAYIERRRARPTPRGRAT